MKKFLFTITFLLFFTLFKAHSVNAESIGICKISQLDKSYDVNVPFYWYKVTQINNGIFGSESQTTYEHIEIYINSKEDCFSINNSSPKFINDQYNFLNYSIDTYNFSTVPLSNSEYIFNNSQSIFELPDISNTKDLTITSEYLSLDNMPPIIANESLNSIIVVPVEHTINANYLKNKITAYDEVDGFVNVEICDDQYSKNHSTLGQYPITFIAKDKTGNPAYLTITINVVDNTIPIISGQTSLKVHMSNLINLDEIKKTLTINDNYYDLSYTQLNTLEDNYSSNTHKEGFFTVSFDITDPSSNTSDPFTLTIEIYDDIIPSIIGVDSYEISNKILLNTDEIKKQLTAIDNIDNNPIIEIASDSYSDNYYKIGIYQITYVAADKNGNQSTPHTINITVKDNTKPTFYISQKFIGVDGSSTISIDQIMEIIEQTNNIDTDKLLSYSIIKDEYSPNKSIPGKYLIELNYEYENQENINVQTYIIVDDYTNKNLKTKNTPQKNFWSTIKQFLLKVWNIIKEIFSFNWIKKWIN